MYKHILFPYEGAEFSRTTESECFLFAKCLGARVTAMRVVPYSDVHRVRGQLPELIQRMATAELDAAAETEARSMLSDLQTRARASGVECDTALTRGGEPYEAIVELAEKSRCDLIIMALHRRALLDALLHGSQTMKVLAHCQIPVLVVRGRPTSLKGRTL